MLTKYLLFYLNDEVNGLQLHTSDKDFSEESSSISNALYVLDAILLYYGDCFCSRTHEK